MPKAEALPPSTTWGTVEASITLTHPDGTETYLVNLDHVSVSAQPKPGAPTAAALTVAGVARMLGVAKKAGALAAHVEAAMLAALFDTAGEPDAADLERIETLRREASAHLPPRVSSPSVRLIGARAGVPAWHRVG
jgi:hypothetical protein